MKPTLIVFARAPRLGRVKRRLAAEIGDMAARHFYRRTLMRLLARVARDPRWRLVLALTPDNGRIAGRSSRPQGRGDLGVRMARALTSARGRAVLVGSDIPALGPTQIARAFRRLASADVVLGPATDGGYYLVGTRRGTLARWMFSAVRWSSPHALADTLANLRLRRVALLDRLADVDTAADLAGADLAAPDFAAGRGTASRASRAALFKATTT
jgi:rSAM/selenodomain-associated transferase 1